MLRCNRCNVNWLIGSYTSRHQTVSGDSVSCDRVYFWCHITSLERSWYEPLTCLKISVCKKPSASTIITPKFSALRFYCIYLPAQSSQWRRHYIVTTCDNGSIIWLTVYQLSWIHIDIMSVFAQEKKSGLDITQNVSCMIKDSMSIQTHAVI